VSKQAITVGALAAIAFLAGCMVTGAVQGPLRCRDGWQSMSIGRQGACSHHGGLVGIGCASFQEERLPFRM
jgi:hypothetical protein